MSSSIADIERTLRSRLRTLSPDGLLLLLLGAWTLLNMVQATLTGLANDEAYYWAWACYGDGRLDWGYYDHPPMVALLVWLTAPLGGTLGVRLATLLLQPLYLWLFWRTLRPDHATRRQALLYAALCFALPALQLYGFLALPDAPLMFFSVLFLYLYKRFLQRQTTTTALLMGVSMALLAYSKYHGALVVAFALLSNPRLWRSWRLYMAGGVALLLFLPHLVWQYQHDWCSFVYHLSSRHKGFEIANPLMVFVNLILIANPLLVWHYTRALFRRPSPHSDTLRDDYLRTMRWIACGVVLFFLVASLRGSTQAQWLLPAVIALVALLADYMWHNDIPRRYLTAALCTSAVLFIAARIVTMVAPDWLKGEFWHNEEKYTQIATLAADRPVVFTGYSSAAKYAFYTGKACSSTPVFYDHPSQWSFRNDDASFYGHEVVVEQSECSLSDTLVLCDGTTFEYRLAPWYRPTALVRLAAVAPQSVAQLTDTAFDVQLACYNPYPYDLDYNDADSLRLTAIFRISQRQQPTSLSTTPLHLTAGDTTIVTAHFVVPHGMPYGTFELGFCLQPLVGWPPTQSAMLKAEYLRK
ncbi:MAG: glycosyltransferase family 39 protein [Bacteroidales bacterium]|nr:glycosyltransferase family 39 protein [Bacteroidales bacterium]